VIGVRGLLKISSVARCTFRRGTHVTRCVAIQTFGGCVATSQRESRAVVVENQVSITRRVTSQTGGAVERVAIHAIVLVVCFGVGMAGDASKNRIIRRVRVAINTLTPFSLVLAAVYGEILAIVVEGRWRPGILIMAARAIRGKLQGSMVGVGRLIVIFCVAAVAGIRRAVVVAVVTGSAVVGDGGMCAIESIRIIVIGKSRWIPFRLCSMTRDTVR
jgi:hypothetical protein